jgi:uncharacterized membrane protein
MWLKIAIFINFALLVISLFSSLIIVYKDKGQTMKPFAALTTRVSLAVLLIILIGYGLASGQIGSRAPWDAFPAAATSAPE